MKPAGAVTLQPTSRRFQRQGRGWRLRAGLLAPLAAALLLLLVAYQRHAAAWTQMNELVIEELGSEAEAPSQEGHQPADPTTTITTTTTTTTTTATTTTVAGWPGSSSTCGPSATARGPRQRVAAYSFYGDVNNTRAYFQGIARNADIVSRLYPGWAMRVYHEVPPGGSSGVSRELEDLSREFPHLDLCYVGDVPGYGDLRDRQQNAWRFLAMADPLVDVFISRDLDALPLRREADAVAEWLRSNATFHVMRDHPWHRVPILAGMWGARPHLKREALRALAEAVTAQPKGRKGLDQTMLAERVWPAIRGDVLQHDAYNCDRFRGHGHMRPFPSRRNQMAAYNFVGNRFGVDTHPVLKKCPVQCRPAQHQDWYYC